MWGEVKTDGTASILVFERRIPRPVEKVWAALITPARIEDWLCARAEVDPRVGGRFHLAFHRGDHRMDGTITRFEPPVVLEYSWPEGAAHGDSVVRWELHADPGGTRLVLTHTLQAGGDLIGFGSGWHWHLDALAHAVDAVATPWDEAGWRALQQEYSARFAAA